MHDPDPLPRSVGFARSRRGSISAVVGLSAPLLIGFLGVAVDIAMWEGSQVGAQAAADQAALAAGLAVSRGGNAANEARAVAASFGFVHNQGGVVVTVNQPPTQGTFKTNGQAVEVLVTKPEGPYFSAAFRPTAPTVRARSVSAPIGTAAGGGMCIMALEPTATGISAGGTPVIDAGTCNIYVNSVHTRAVNITGSVRIKGYDIFIGGGIRATGGAAVTPSNEMQTYYATPTPDPYAARTIPAYSGCTANNPSWSGSNTYNVPSSGTGITVICGNLSLSGSGTVNFAPGIYIFDRGSMAMSGTMTIQATGGVSLIFTSSTGSGFGGISMSGGQTVNIKAPPTGDSAGIALWIDKRASAGFSVSGGSVWNVTGAMYVPNGALTWSGSGTSPCTQLVARTINLNGSGVLRHECAGVGVSDPPGSGGATMSRLVE